MDPARARRHGKHRALAPALWLAATVLALCIFSLTAIVLLILHAAQLLIEIAGYAWPA